MAPKQVYFTLQGKGGVSKSTTTIWLHQYFLSQGKTVKGYDTDPNNATYAAFESLNVQVIDIMDSKHNIKQSKFDILIESILQDEEEIICIDNGATSFNAILSYIQENDTFSLLQEYKIETIINTVCVGGSEHNESMKGIHYLFTTTKVPLLIWLNRYFGEIPKGKAEPVVLLKENLKDRLIGIIEIPEKNSDTFGETLQLLHGERMTFDDYLEDETKQVTKKHRIKTFKKELFKEIEKVKI